MVWLVSSLKRVIWRTQLLKAHTLLIIRYKIFAKQFNSTFNLSSCNSLVYSIHTSFHYDAFLTMLFWFKQTLHWPNISNQPTIFSKLDFSKLYKQKLSWHIWFETMSRLRMHEIFIKWIKMLFGNAWAYVYLSGNPLWARITHPS